MLENKKTLKISKIYKTKHFLHNIKTRTGQNRIMQKNENELKEKCNVQLMPPTISDADITALFNGLLGIVKRKIELDTRSEIINLNLTQEKLIKELKAKQAECTRLKNEIIYLKSKIKE